MRVLILVLSFVMTACAQLAPVRDNVVIGVEKYCKSFSFEQRVIFRTEANATLQRVCVVSPDGTKACGASITIKCPGDPA